MTAAGSTPHRRRAGTPLRTVGAVLAGAVALGAVIISTRGEGYPRQAVEVFAGTRWLVDRAEGTLVLGDALTGRATVVIDADRAAHALSVAQGPSGAYLLDTTQHDVVTVDQKAVRLGEPRDVPELVETRSWRFGAGPRGAIAVTDRDLTGLTIPDQGTPTELVLPPADGRRVIARDGAVWTVTVDGLIQRADVDGTTTFQLDDSLQDVALGTLGDQGILLNRSSRELTWIEDGTTTALPLTIDLADAVLQDPSAEAPCAWVGAGDQLTCLTPDGVVDTVRLTGFSFFRTDRVLAAADVLVILREDGSTLVVDRARGEAVPVVAIDWNDPTQLVASVDELSVWIDDPTGPTAVAVTASHGAKVVEKRDPDTPEFASDGKPKVTEGAAEESGTSIETSGSFSDGAGAPPEPDDNGIDDPPVANPDTATGREDSTLTVQVTSNDYDPDGGPVALVSVEQPAHGVARVLNAGAVVYEPQPGYSGTDTFRYTIVDDSDQPASAEVEVHVFDADDENRAPSTSSDRAETVAGQAVEIDVLANDIDPEQQALVISRVGQPTARGRVSVLPPDVAGRPTLRFEPDPAYPGGGTVTFTYRAADSDGAESPDTAVTVTINTDGNRAPQAAPDAAQVVRGASITIPVLENDTDPDNDLLSVTEIELESRDGTAQITSTGIVFTASTNAPDRVRFTYTVTDPDGEEDEAAVLVNVLDPATDNRDPIARPDTALAGDASTTIEPLRNDEDPDGDPLIIERAVMVGAGSGTGAGGVVDERGGTQLVFTPNPGFEGIARIEYTVSDGRGGSARSTVTVTVTGERITAGPLAADDRYQLTAGETEQFPVLQNDTSPEGGPLTLASATDCAPGSCTVVDNRIEFTAPLVAPANPIVFTYRVTDTAGRSDTGEVAVRVLGIEPTAAALPPIANADSDVVTAGSSVSVDVLGNDDDPDGDPSTLQITSVTGQRAGVTAAPAPDGRVLVSVPEDFPDRSLQLQYEITDSDGLTARASIGLRVLPLPTAPIAPTMATVARELTAGETLTIALTSAITDADGRRETVTVVPVDTGGSGLVARMLPRQTIELTARDDASGEFRVRLDLTDESGERGTGLLLITVVLPANAAPVADDDTYVATAGVPVTLPVLQNDDDADGDALTVRVVSQPPGGRVTPTNGDTTLQFTADPEHPGGTVSFTYVAVDALGEASAPATVRVTISQCGDEVPQAPDRSEFTPYETPLTLDLLGAGQAGFTVTPADVRGGTLTPVPGRDGVYVFRPDDGNNGVGSFAYVVRNSCGNQRRGAVVVDVNRAPSVRAASFTMTLGEVLDLEVARFASDEEALQITSAVASNGTAAVVGAGTLRFTPAAPGTATIEVTVADPGGLTATGPLTVEVLAAEDDPPVAVDDFFTIAPGAVHQLDVLRNDVDPDATAGGMTVRLATTTVTIGGVPIPLAVDADGRVVATVPADVHGTGTFTYRAADARGGLSEPATVTVTVNRPPTPVTRTYSVAAGTTARFDIYPGGTADPDGDDIVSLVTFVSAPGVTIDFQPGFVIVITVAADVPAGPVTARYRITDELGAVSTAELTIDVSASGAPPTTPPTPETAPTVPPETTAPDTSAPPPDTQPGVVGPPPTG